MPGDNDPRRDAVGPGVLAVHADGTRVHRDRRVRRRVDAGEVERSTGAEQVAALEQRPAGGVADRDDDGRELPWFDVGQLHGLPARAAYPTVAALVAQVDGRALGAGAEAQTRRGTGRIDGEHLPGIAERDDA